MKSSDSPLEEFLLPERKARIDSVLSHRSRSLVLVLDQVMNAHNISAVMRSADAFGVQEIHLVGDEFEFSSGISLGTERWLELNRYKSAEDAIEALRKRGYRFVVLESPRSSTSTDGATPPIPVYDLPFGEKLALVFGNEHRGISPAFGAAADLRAYIPMLGFAESFNISVAAAITMYSSLLGKVEGKRQYEALSATDYAATKEAWIAGSIRRGNLILREVQARERGSNSKLKEKR